jgi:CRP-like cAMP-binding protein
MRRLMSEARLNGGLNERRATLRATLENALHGCRPQTIRSLTELARPRTLRRGDRIYRQGEAVPLTLILRGYGIAQRTTADGQILMSGVAPAGNLFGYSGIHAAPSSVELIAVTDCEVVQWPGSEIRALVVDDPGLALAAIDSMADSLHASVELIEGFLHQDARRRVLRVLAKHRELFFGEPAILDRTHLPGLVGTSREMTRRVLRQLESEGTLVRVGRAGMRLLEPERLDGRPT